MVILLFLVAWLFAPVVATAENDTPDKSALTVTGQGQVSLAPDTAFVTIGIETTGKTVTEAERENRLVMKKIVERLKAMDIEQERIQTASFTVSPQFKPPPKRSESPAGPPEITGYIISNAIMVEVLNLDKVGSVIEESLAAGANQFHGLHWALRDEQPGKLSALTEAAGKAREKAAALSGALKVKLVRLLHATEESHLVRPQAKMARSMVALDGGGGDTPILSGEMKVEATVTVIYEVSQD